MMLIKISILGMKKLFTRICDLLEKCWYYKCFAKVEQAREETKQALIKQSGNIVLSPSEQYKLLDYRGLPFGYYDNKNTGSSIKKKGK